MNRNYASDFKEFEIQVKAYFYEYGYQSADVLSSILDPKDFKFSLFKNVDLNMNELDPSRLYYVTFITVKDREGVIHNVCCGASTAQDTSLSSCVKLFATYKKKA